MNPNTYGFAQPSAHDQSGYDYHHRHPYHAGAAGGPGLSPSPDPMYDDKQSAPLSLSSNFPSSPSAPLAPIRSYSADSSTGSYTRGTGEPSYPHYAHYEIPTRSPSTRSVSRPPKGTTSNPDELKEGELPHGWTKEDEEAEAEFLKAGLFNWRELTSWRFWIRLEWWYWYIILIVCCVLVILMTVYHDQIVEWLTPAANWMKALPAGWTIPIAVLFVLSFPPLFGHEIVAIICGIVWGLWVGFGIVAAGTFLGEVGNYWAFKYCLRSTAEKYENKNISYHCLSYVMREGGFWIVFMARLSAIPGHFTTAVFATCGMNVWIFLIATFLTLPKQLVTVYLGVLIHQKDKSLKNKIVSYTVLAIGFLVTVYAAWYIYHRMHKVRVHVWRVRRMKMASRGIALGEIGYTRDIETGDEASTPILMTHPHRQTSGDALAVPTRDDRHASYVNPYDIRYDRNNDMSVYHVDALTERVNLEEDIADRIQRMRSPPPSMPSVPAQYQEGGERAGAFPQATPSGLTRDPSAAGAFYPPGASRPQAIPSVFPVAAPIPPPQHYQVGGQI